jgi:putative ABC transport system substrate-binding protein
MTARSELLAVSSKKTGEPSIVRRIVICLLLTVFLLTVAEAQQPTKIPKIGYLNAASLSVTAVRAEAFRQGLRELGYIEGRNIAIEWRSGDGKEDRLPALADELVRLKVDLIVTSGPVPTRSAKEATVTIPIVMAQDPLDSSVDFFKISWLD